MQKEKRFLSYDEQIKLLKNKKLKIENDEIAKDALKRFSYYSLISGYKDIFKVEKNGNYKSDATFNKIVTLYNFDEALRNIFLHEIIRIEKSIKSIYSYTFCEEYGDKQKDYLNVNNYNYSKYQKEINEFTSIIQNLLNSPEKYTYINYNIKKYGTVPLWVIIHTLTFGNLAKMFSFSKQSFQSKISKNYPDVYNYHLDSMLNVISKFRNVCAHGERLYNYRTQKSIKNLPVHSKLKGYHPKSKNDLFNVLISIKYLSPKDNFIAFVIQIDELIENTKKIIGNKYTQDILQSMGFPKNWKEITKI